MDVTKLIIICLALSASESRAQILKTKTPSSDKSAKLVEATTDILLSCYEKDVNTVGFAGISESILLKTLWYKRLLPVTLIGNGTTDVINGPVDKEPCRKLQIFVITTSSTNQLKQILEQIKRSRWWNHMATFLILDWQSSTKYIASNAFQFLSAAWQIDILKALYVGFHPTKGLLIYSYNPYTRQAPEPWQLNSMHTGKNDHPFAMFVREYGDSERICENLDFDKSNDLGGYRIIGSMRFITTNKTVTPNVVGVSPVIRTAFVALNAILRVFLHPVTPEEGKVSNTKMLFNDAVNGISDLVTPHYSYHIAENLTTSYVDHVTGLIVVTQYTRYMSQVEKLIAVFDRSVRIGLCLVAVSIVIFFKCFRRETLSTAILNLFRLATYSGLTKEPKNQGARIYLAGVFILVVTILGVYQGLFASLLTNSKSLPNVNTMQDLVQSDHKIYVRADFVDSFSDSAFKGRLIQNGYDDCTEYVLRNSSVACILLHEDLAFIDKTVTAKLHISKPIINLFMVTIIRKDWPVEERYNMMRSTMIETGITRYLSHYSIDKKSRKENYHAKLAEDTPYRTINLSDITFMFAFLGISLGCAFVCFTVEIATNRASSKIRNVFGYIQSRLGLK